MKQLLAFIVVVILAGCQTTPEYVKRVIGSVHSEVFDIGNGIQVPLPEGNWTVIASTTFRNNAGSPLARIVLAKEKNKVLDAALYIVSLVPGTVYNDVGFTQAFSSYKTCNRNNMLHVETRINGGSDQQGEQDCWFINHVNLTFSSKERSLEYLKQAREYITKNGISLPVTTISVGHRVASLGKLVTIKYFFNPETRGFSPPAQAQWRTNDWHVDRYRSDEKKKKFIGELVSWSRAWHKKVKLGYDGQLAAPRPIPVKSGNPAPGAANKGTVEQKLAHIKALLEKGLISREEAAAKRAEILKGL